LYAWEFEKNNRELKVRVDGQLIFNGLTQRLNAALSGFGLAYVPEDVAQPHLAQGRLKRVLEDWCWPFPGYHLYCPTAATPHRLSPCWLMRCAPGLNAKTPRIKFSTRSFLNPQLSKHATLFVIRNLLNDLNGAQRLNGLNVWNSL
jgi:hypothetical protein